MAKRKSKKTTTQKTKTTKAKTARKKPTVKDEVNASAQPGNATSFRVYAIENHLRESLVERKGENLTYRSLIRLAVLDPTTGIRPITAGLNSLHLVHTSSQVSKVRWEIDDDILAMVRLSSQQTKCAAAHLMIACLHGICVGKGCE